MRPLTADDLVEICALINRAQQADGIAQQLTLAELVEQLTSEAYDLPNRSLAVLDDAGGIVAFSLVEHRPAAVLGADEQTCHLEGCVDPRWRRQGLGTALLDWSVEVSTAVLQALDGDLPKRIRFGTYETIADIAVIAARAGFVPVRWFEELLRPLDDLPQPATVAGIRVERWPEGRDEELRAVKNTAFRDHWGSSLSTAEAWRTQLHGHTGRLDLSFVAVDEASDEPVALLVTGRYPDDDALLGRRDGWVQTLATLRPWRGRGLGSALIARALAAYAAAGLTHASIGVDSDNPSGAARLYRQLGFQLSRRSVVHQLALN